LVRFVFFHDLRDTLREFSELPPSDEFEFSPLEDPDDKLAELLELSDGSPPVMPANARSR